MGQRAEPHAQSALAEKAHQEFQRAGYGAERLIRRPEVEARTGLSRSTIYEWMKRGDFPQPVKLGERLVAWRESDVVAWLEALEARGN